VPILEFLVALGVPSADVVAKLKSSSGGLYYGDELLETGFYVPEGGTPKPDSRSWASAQELLEVVGK
jgi:hypothetical protein